MGNIIALFDQPPTEGMHPGVILAIVFGGFIILAACVGFYFCNKQSNKTVYSPYNLPNPQGSGRFGTPSPVPVKRGGDGGGSARRRLATPFAKLVDELKLSSVPQTLEPATHRVLAQEPDVVEKILSMNGIEYVLGASCITQLLGCALG